MNCQSVDNTISGTMQLWYMCVSMSREPYAHYFCHALIRTSSKLTISMHPKILHGGSQYSSYNILQQLHLVG